MRIADEALLNLVVFVDVVSADEHARFKCPEC